MRHIVVLLCLSTLRGHFSILLGGILNSETTSKRHKMGKNHGTQKTTERTHVSCIRTEAKKVLPGWNSSDAQLWQFRLFLALYMITGDFESTMSIDFGGCKYILVNRQIHE